MVKRRAGALGTWKPNCDAIADARLPSSTASDRESDLGICAIPETDEEAKLVHY
jgi:hypothetical protein